MDKKKFQSLARMAKSFQELDSKRSEFWQGFQRGLRRLFHGDNFGTLEEHRKWINCADGEYRKQLQTGYRAGYHCEDLKIDGSDDVQPLRKLLAISAAELAEIALVSPRTVEGWEQGRQISAPALQLIRKFLMMI
jgi:hypothetical protein